MGEEKSKSNLAYDVISWIGWALFAIGLGMAVSGSYVHYYAGVMPGIVAVIVGLIIIGIHAVIKPKGIEKKEE